jgi:hypothetical protein
MILNFNQNGNLRQSITLSYETFKKQFGFNEFRKEKIEHLLIFLKIFQSLGCTNVYIVGSFVSNKEHPADIDFCVDSSHLNYLRLSKEYPEFLQPGGIEKIKKEHKCHLALMFDTSCIEYLDWFKKDKNDKYRGIVRIHLTDIDKHGKE